MKSANDQYAVCLTIPTLLGFAAAIWWTYFPVPYDGTQAMNYLRNLQVLFLNLSLFAVFFVLIEYFIFIKGSYKEMRLDVLIICSALQIAWCLYIGHTMGTFHILPHQS